MTSNRPYLIRALFEWILDNGMTPHLLVDAMHPRANVPTQFVEEGRIVLNISPSAVHGLALGNDTIRFSARFGGVAMQVELPPAAVLALYARENGHGMVFPREEAPLDSDPKPGKAVKPDFKPSCKTGDDKPRPERPSLRIVK